MTNIIIPESISSPEKQKHIQCVICNTHLQGKQTRFCSTYCKNQESNNKHQNYIAQRKRSLYRKLELILSFGGRCKSCGYDKNLAALCFHHKDGKDFKLDLRSLANRTWEKVKNEAERCELLCHNCHMEKHHPDLELEYLASDFSQADCSNR